MNRLNLRLDFVVIIGLVLICIPLVLLLQARFIISTLLFFGVPALYLVLRKPKSLKRILIATGAATIFLFGIDLLAELNNAWSWAPEGQLLFKNKILGVVPIDVVIYYLLFSFFMLVLYEHFFEHERSDKVSPRFRLFLLFAISLDCIIIMLFLFAPSLITFPYAYFWIALIGSCPLYYIIAKKPRLALKIAKADLFPIFLLLVFEITAIKLDQWRFPGIYIGEVQLFGQTFAFEEFLFWVILGAATAFSYYELFIDDER